jgi:hypothetical protein
MWAGGRFKTAKRKLEMPPNSTQNLNAKLSMVPTNHERPGAGGISLTPSPIQGSGPQNQIVGGPAQYRGGYHLSF